ncbi:MAG: DUF3293 domain-containing protein [Gemmatimonas sp.]
MMVVSHSRRLLIVKMDYVDDPTWTQYSRTILEFPDGLRVDLQEPLSNDVRARISASIGENFAIVSAADPKGQDQNDNINVQAVHNFRCELDRRSIRYFPIIGRAADGSHIEESLVLLAPMDEARRMASDADQSAYFWFDGAAFWLMGARVDHPPVRLPRKL